MATSKAKTKASEDNMDEKGDKGDKGDKGCSIKPMTKGTSGKEQIRFEAFTTRGKETVASIRVFYNDKASNKMLPGRQGLTLRRSEISAFAKKLRELYDSLPEDSADDTE